MTLALKSARILVKFFGGSARQSVIDLVPGSSKLNVLNYGSADFSGEEFACTTHPIEDISGAPIYSLAGTNHCSWFSRKPGHWLIHNQENACETTDGAVPVQSAEFRRGVGFYLDSELGCSVEHLMPDEGCVGLTSSRCIGGAVVDLLQGRNPTVPKAPALLARSETPTSSLLPAIEALVAVGSTYEDSSNVQGLIEATFLCLWDNDSLAYSLVTPTGTEIGPDYADTATSVTFVGDSTTAMYTIQNPASGLWHHRVDAITTSAPESLLILVGFDTDVTLEAQADGPIDPAGSFHVTAIFLDAGVPIPTGAVTAEIRRPDSTAPTVVLRDDGVIPDSTPGDGVYTAEHDAAGLEGAYVLTVTAQVDSTDPASEERQVIVAAEAERLPDLAIESPGLVLSATTPLLGSLDTLTASVRNDGAASADSLVFSIRDLTHSVLLAVDTLALGPGAAASLTAFWTAEIFDTTRFAAHATLLGGKAEASLTNNVSTSYAVVNLPNISIGVANPENAEGEVQAPFFPTGPAVLSLPNPAIGAPRIQYRVSGGGQTSVSVVIYDIRGRRVRDLLDRQALPGIYEVEWDRRDDRGRRVGPGVYFYRVKTGSEVSIGRSVVIQ